MSSSSTAPPFLFEVGAQLFAPLKDSVSPCVVIERRHRPSHLRPEYYIHFLNLDRRLDRWLDQQQLQANNENVKSQQQQQHTAGSTADAMQVETTNISAEHSIGHGHTQQSADTPMRHTDRRITRRDRQRIDLPSSPHANLASSAPAALPASSLSSSGAPAAASMGLFMSASTSSASTSSAAAAVVLTSASDATEQALEREHEERTKVKNIEKVEIGEYELDCWYFSPFPDDVKDCSKLYFCPFCLKYCQRDSTMEKHRRLCTFRHPPGNEIYRDGNTSVFEVDGEKHKIYGQCLCLLAKLFIDHKTLYYDVEPFLFYILTERDDTGYQMVAYFSKEKKSQDSYNVACILVFPQYQRRGYGRFLIALSYELTRRESKVGSPEKPLSDLGKISYRSYWQSVLIEYLYHSHQANETPTLADISTQTGIKKEDIISTLSIYSFVRYHRGEYVLDIVSNRKTLESMYAQLTAEQAKASKNMLIFQPQKLQWEYKPKHDKGKGNKANKANKRAATSATTTNQSQSSNIKS